MEYPNENKMSQPSAKTDNQGQNFPSMPPQNSSRNIKILVGALVVLLVVGVGVASFYIFGNKTVPQNEQPNPKVSNQIMPSQQKKDAILFSRSI